MQRGNPIELKFEGLEMQKWNIPADRAQRVDGEHGVSCLVITFTPRVRFIKMPKWLIFCIYCWWMQKVSHSLGKNVNWNRDISFNLSKNDPELPLARWKPFKMKVYLNISPKLGLHFYSHQLKIQKMSHFWHFNDFNSGSYDN